MPAVIDKKRHYRTIDKTCYVANSIYLFLHVFYLVLFIISKFNILVYVMAGIIVIDLLFFILLVKKKYYIYALCCGNMYFGLVSVTTIMLGFASGFHLYLLGLCVVSFFTSYFSKVKNVKGSIVWVALSLAIYLTLYFVTKFNKPYYEMPQWLEIALFTTHAIAVFALVASYLVVFLKYALSLENKIMNESRTDELTQIGNRYSLYDYFDDEEDKSTKVLVLFDIDNFKGINDTHGHATGDHILRRVAEITTTTLSDSFVCRYGGEEFIIVMEADKNGPFKSRLETLRKAFEKETFEFGNMKINITITLGAVKYHDGISLEKWVQLADEKMYYGKKTGKNKLVV